MGKNAHCAPEKRSYCTKKQTAREGRMIATCAQCGAENRVPLDKLEKIAK